MWWWHMVVGGIGRAGLSQAQQALWNWAPKFWGPIFFFFLNLINMKKFKIYIIFPHSKRNLKPKRRQGK
jgi:hypothetical protein